MAGPAKTTCLIVFFINFRFASNLSKFQINMTETAAEFISMRPVAEDDRAVFTAGAGLLHDDIAKLMAFFDHGAAVYKRAADDDGREEHDAHGQSDFSFHDGCPSQTLVDKYCFTVIKLSLPKMPEISDKSNEYQMVSIFGIS